MTDEIWKKVAIEYYSEKYEISTYGRVKSLHKEPKIINTCLRTEYEGIQLNYKGKGKTFSIHRLVALTFIPNPNNYTIVNHKNGNKLDNRLENLEWTNIKDNVKHAIDTSLRINRTYRVSQYTVSGELVSTFESVSQASKTTGILDTKICTVCKGKRKTAGGYIWKYTDFEWKDMEEPVGKVLQPFTNYIITVDGNIYSKSHKKFISQTTNSGYKYVTLCCSERKIKTIAVHILVATVFLGNPNKLPYVNHKNYDRSDNRLENLEWCSPSTNMIHFGKKHKQNEQKSKDMLV